MDYATISNLCIAYDKSVYILSKDLKKITQLVFIRL